MVVFLVIMSSVILAGGTGLSLAASAISLKGNDKQTALLSKMKIPSAPRGFLGQGDNPGSSPVYGIMWTIIYAVNIASSVFLLLAGLSNTIIPESDADACFNASACMGAAFIATSAWPMTYELTNSHSASPGRHLTWPLWMSVAIVAVASVLGLWGLHIYQPALKGDLAVFLLLSVPWSFFVGWLLIATAVGIAMAYSADIHGGPREYYDSVEPDTWFGPLLATSVVAIIAGSYGEPFLALPAVLYTLFIRLDWKHGLAFGAAVLGVAGGFIRMALKS